MTAVNNGPLGLTEMARDLFCKCKREATKAPLIPLFLLAVFVVLLSKSFKSRMCFACHLTGIY